MDTKEQNIKSPITKYSIEEIESALIQHPKIFEAAVIVQKPKGYVERLIAFFSVKEQQLSPTTEDLRIYFKKSFPNYLIPYAFIELDQFPRTSTGELDRACFPNFEDVFSLEKDFIPPQNDIERQLKIVWEDLFSFSPIGIKHDFFQLGGNSLMAASLVTRIEEIFGQRLEISIISELLTIEELAKVISSDGLNISSSPLIAIRAFGSKPPLFCVHGVGGHVLPFLQLADNLGIEQPVYGFQSVFAEILGDHEYTIEKMAEMYTIEIKKIQSEGPYFLTGFSFGGFVAYEIARQLKSQGDDIGILTILDTRADSAPRYRDALNFSEYAGYKLMSLTERIEFHEGNTTGFSLLEKIKYLHKREEQPSARDVILGDVDIAQIPERMQGVMDANIAALRRYIPGRYTGDILLFRSIDHGRGNYYGWEELISGEVIIYDVPGNHRGILQEPNVSILARKIQESIDEI